MGEMTVSAGPFRTFGEAEVAAYAALTADFNPIHLDAAFAADTPFGRPIVHGTLFLALAWELLAGDETAAEVRFRRPVFVGEPVRAVREGDTFRIEKGSGETAVEGRILGPPA